MPRFPKIQSLNQVGMRLLGGKSRVEVFEKMDINKVFFFFITLEPRVE